MAVPRHRFGMVQCFNVNTFLRDICCHLLETHSCGHRRRWTDRSYTLPVGPSGTLQPQVIYEPQMRFPLFHEKFGQIWTQIRQKCQLRWRLLQVLLRQSPLQQPRHSPLRQPRRSKLRLRRSKLRQPRRSKLRQPLQSKLWQPRQSKLRQPQTSPLQPQKPRQPQRLGQPRRPRRLNGCPQRLRWRRKIVTWPQLYVGLWWGQQNKGLEIPGRLFKRIGSFPREMCSYAKCWYSGEDLPVWFKVVELIWLLSMLDCQGLVLSLWL